MEDHFAEWNRRGDETWARIVDEVREREELIGGDFIQQNSVHYLFTCRKKRAAILVYSSLLVSTKEGKSLKIYISVCPIFEE